MPNHLDAWNPYPLPPLPAPLARLGELAYNLWWSWQPEARAIFEAIDPVVWTQAGENPVRFLRRVGPERLNAAAHSAPYLAQLAAALDEFDRYLGAQDTPFARAHPNLAGQSALCAYFSAEFGVHETLPIYSGGLGVLAGDHCKAASDLGVPLVAVGLLYPQGYFTQTIDSSGAQGARYDRLHVADAPIRQAIVNGQPVAVDLTIGAQSIEAQVWYVRVGRVTLFLLDTDVANNLPNEREVGYKLYGGGPGIRLRQEMVLGIGGVRALRQIGLAPRVWHLNEGHAAFAPLERMRELVAQGLDFEVARQAVAASTVFTTHTPVKAGHDEFTEDFMLAHFDNYIPQLGLTERAFLDLARREHDDGSRFSMTALAFRLSGRHNAVSVLHGRVTRAMWQDLWPDVPEDQLPVTAITNGVHQPTWMAPRIEVLIRTATGVDVRAPEASGLVTRETLANISDAKLWEARCALKEQLIAFVRAKEMERRTRLGWSGGTIDQAKHLLDPRALTIGFARRFATYKRAGLIFRDPDRLAAILADAQRPVQLVFAGKAHPADEPGQAVLAEIYRHSMSPTFAGRVVVIEDYDMAMARRLTQGVDVWLNTPRRPREASGTSGQKAAMNGVPNVSVLDGWWAEGFQGDNGWAIGPADGAPDAAAPEDEVHDARDAEALFEQLEFEILPRFYDRDPDGIPRRWLAVCRAAIAGVLPAFSAARMVGDYLEVMYMPALESMANMVAQDGHMGQAQAVAGHVHPSGS